LLSLGETGLFKWAARRFSEAASALVAIRCSSTGGLESALVGIRPNTVKASPAQTRARKVAMVPKIKLRIFSFRNHVFFPQSCKS
jgi:hypothetical protein